ncbi:MAG TPA: glycosyltransferase family 4 protein [Solirubrobacteraceae bacterium]|jgi:glycosyltransferase involved in cell wall biosynthesis|nr:glycosyltransferase family 4 protein [Solirubrobacteraceae bacterium]
MRVAAVHHLPTGGAMRVMAEWLARTSAQEVTLYSRDSRAHRFVTLPARVNVVERPLHGGGGVVNEMARLLRSPHDGRRLAREIDAGGYDAVLCFASQLTQAIDVLPFLRTPSLYYAPEPLRSAYEPCALAPAAPGLRGRLAAIALGSIERRRRQLDRRYIRAARRIVTHSRFTREVLHEIYGVDSAVVPLGVDSDAFTPAALARERWVLSVGALHPLKGHERVIEAIATLTPPRPALVVVGDRGDGERSLRELASARSVELQVHSGLAFAEVVRLYQRAGVVACAQIREPFGLVPLEAMACATPVVAVAEGGFRETVRDGETGLLVAPDAGALGSAIATVLGDGELAAKLGRNGRAEVQRDWSWARTAEGYDRLLEAR